MIDSGSIQVEVPKGVDCRTKDMVERCMAMCGRATGARATRSDLVEKKKHQLRKCKDTTSSLLKQNILSTNPGLTRRFLISLT